MENQYWKSMIINKERDFSEDDYYHVIKARHEGALVMFHEKNELISFNDDAKFISRFFDSEEQLEIKRFGKDSMIGFSLPISETNFRLIFDLLKQRSIIICEKE